MSLQSFAFVNKAESFSLAFESVNHIYTCKLARNCLCACLLLTSLKPFLVSASSNKPSMRALSKESAMPRVFVVNMVF